MRCLLKHCGLFGSQIQQALPSFLSGFPSCPQKLDWKCWSILSPTWCPLVKTKASNPDPHHEKVMEGWTMQDTNKIGNGTTRFGTLFELEWGGWNYWQSPCWRLQPFFMHVLLMAFLHNYTSCTPFALTHSFYWHNGSVSSCVLDANADLKMYAVKG